MKKYLIFFTVVFVSYNASACLSKMMSEEDLKWANESIKEEIQEELSDWQLKTDYSLKVLQKNSYHLSEVRAKLKTNRSSHYKNPLFIGDIFQKSCSDMRIYIPASKEGFLARCLLKQYINTYCDTVDYFNHSLNVMNFCFGDLGALRKNAASVLRFTKVTNNFLKVLSFDSIDMIDMKDLLLKNPPIVCAELKMMKADSVNTHRELLIQGAHNDSDLMHPCSYILYYNCFLEFLMNNTICSVNKIFEKNNWIFRQYLRDNSKKTLSVLPSMVECADLYNDLGNVERKKKISKKKKVAKKKKFSKKKKNSAGSTKNASVETSLFQESMSCDDKILESNDKVFINGIPVDISPFQEPPKEKGTVETLSVEENVVGSTSTSKHIAELEGEDDVVNEDLSESDSEDSSEDDNEDLSEDGNMNEDLNRLEEILDEYGRVNGMGTRTFLAFASALNGLGYFSEFSTSKKEVHAKLLPSQEHEFGKKGMYHTMHGNKKGISNRTASEFKDMIEALREKILEE